MIVNYGIPNEVPAPIIPPLYDKEFRKEKGLPLPDCPEHLCITSKYFCAAKILTRKGDEED